MHYPWMIMIGGSLIGWVAAEVFTVVTNRRLPVGINILCAIAGAMISGGIVL